MDGNRRVRAANAISRAWRNRPAARRSFKLSRMARWRGRSAPLVHRFKRTASTNASGSYLQITTDTLGIPSFSAGGIISDNIQLAFSLQELRLYVGGTLAATTTIPGYTELTALFDTWCIEKVDVMFLPSFNGQTMSTNVLSNLPSIVYAVDTDDSNAADRTALQQYGNCKYTSLINTDQSPLKLATFRPRIQVPMYQAGVNWAYGEAGRNTRWVDTATPGCMHYGFKAAMDASLKTGALSSYMGQIDIVVRYHFALKTSR